MALISPVTDFVKKLILRDTKLKYHYRNGTGHYGYKLADIKSALQKGCRRKEKDLVAFAIREAYLYFRLGFSSNNILAKSFNTNIINRLKIIAVEDCSPRALLATNESARCLEKYKNSGFENPQYLMDSGMYLAQQAAGSRVCSHLRVLCSENGYLYSLLSSYDISMNTQERINVLFWPLTNENISLLTTNDKIKNCRTIAAYQTMRIYHSIKKRNNNILTPKTKRVLFAPFWIECLKLIESQSKVNQRVNFYKNELLYAVEWRRDFFCSKYHFHEESLFLISMIDLLIAVLVPNDEFDVIQRNKKEENTSKEEEEDYYYFDWIRDHRAPTPTMPSYVMDQHSSSPNKSVSFALNSSAIVDGDENWTPDDWLEYYTIVRLKNERHIINNHAIITPEIKARIDNVRDIEETALRLTRELMQEYEKKKNIFKKKRSKSSSSSHSLSPDRKNTTVSSSSSSTLSEKKRKLMEKRGGENDLDDNCQPRKKKIKLMKKKSLAFSSEEKKNKSNELSLSSSSNATAKPQRILEIEKVNRIIQVHNNFSRKAVVATVNMSDGSNVVLKHMTKSLGYGTHQNFIQNLKDSDICQFEYLYPTPHCSSRGLVSGKFEIQKTQNPKEAYIVPCKKYNVYFVTGSVTQKNGCVVDVRFSHCSEKNRGQLWNPLELVHIIAFRMLTGVNDTNHSNILIGENHKLYSIDENNAGSMTPGMTVKTKMCKYLKKLLRQHPKFNNMSSDEMKTHMPPWMKCEYEREAMLKRLYIQGLRDGISEETLLRIKENSKFTFSILFEFLYKEDDDDE